MDISQLQKNWSRGEPIWEWSFLSIYSITMFLGIIASFLVISIFWRRQKYSWEILQIMLIITVPSAIAGARLWYLIFEGGWANWFVLEGLSIHGGVIGATIGVVPYAWSKRNVIDFRIAFSIIVPNVLIGQVIGRWGNFSNHEVYGKIVDGGSLGWLWDHMYIDGAFRAPLFFYESMLNFSAWIIFVWVILNNNYFKPGTLGAFYFIWYGIVRIIMEPMRDPADIMTIGTLPISMIISGVWILAGLILVFFWEITPEPHYPWAKKVFSKRFLSTFDKKYKLITSPRSVRRYVLFGQKVDIKQRVWIPAENDKWSKREINRGTRSKK